jgi:uncharacterized protein YdeI (YjbR/CyaY-like superfamily)
MESRSPEVDAYIARAPEFARPILERIRAAFHAGCPDLEERLKWGVPSFEHKGLLGGMAAFKAHVSYGFWKGRLMPDCHRALGVEPRSGMMRVRVAALADLPSRRALIACVREARRLNDAGEKEPRPAKKRVIAPTDLKAALAGSAKARETFDAFPPSHRRAYIEWITEAKRADTRARRLETTIEWLAAGKRYDWKHKKRS